MMREFNNLGLSTNRFLLHRSTFSHEHRKSKGTREVRDELRIINARKAYENNCVES